MTEAQAKQLKELRMKGVGYRSIASVLGLSRDVVRNYCKQKGLDGYASAFSKNIIEQMEQGAACNYCGNKIEQPAIGRKKKFCSDKCRREWWKSHPEAVNRKDTAIYKLTCSKCDQEFESYGNKNRKYCSNKCYITDRFYEEEHNGV